ncbi:MAG: aldehyde dehydrogenase family protein, partial [Bacteroidales bacterium]
TDSLSNETIDVYNPATHEFIDNVPSGKKEDIDRAVQIAKEGYRINRSLPGTARYKYLIKAGELILKNLAKLRTTMIEENGKSYSWADFEIRKTAEIFITIAARIKDPQGTTFPMDSMEGSESQMSMVYRQPRGVVGGIIPFNFPMEMLAYKIAGALAPGNSIVIKLSEDCPLTCLMTGELLMEAGIPKEAMHLVPGYGETAGVALVEHPDVPMITFTGSSAVGKNIMERSARYLKHLSLEL